MKKGFTLVEVLIVVVIIAILAALTVPRMIAQVNKAKAAEAFQMIGALRRAAEKQFSLTGSYRVGTGENIISSPGAMLSGDWAWLGLKDLEKSKHWEYYYWQSEDYSPGGTAFVAEACAYDLNGTPENWEDDSLIGDLSYDSASNQWSCDGIFKYKVPGDPSKGCTV